MPSRQQVSWRPVAGAAALTGVLLGAGAGGYGYHRDELYFRMLPPAWAYVDQPPVTPALARLAAAVSDHAWVMHLVPLVALVVTVLLAALLTAELGGGRGAQVLSAFGLGLSASAMMFGHLLLTSTVDLPLWTGLVLCWVRALRRDPRWWVAVGLVAGVTTANRWLVVVLLLGLAGGLLASGPRSALRSPCLWAGAVVALLVAAPGLGHQANHGWPQLTMGGALSANNAAEVRVQMWVLLLVLLGPPLVPIWVTGLWWLASGRGGRDVRSLAVAFVAVVAFTFVAGAQPHYTVGVLVVAYAAGCVPVAKWLVGHRFRRRATVAAVAVNGVVAVLLGLPVVPVTSLGSTPIPGISQLVADQVGWPDYVDQITEAYVVAATRPGAGTVAVVTSNYGEAGAVARYGPDHGLPGAYSGQNHLWSVARPPDSTTTVVIVGGQLDHVSDGFATCEVVTRLDNGVDVDNEEQGLPVAVCSGPREPWSRLWARFRHLD